ncbi:anthranilate synthase component I [Halegenticoccus tardaugens]|uniref:anthranilate synthase component I n=1 Tax=Halegenticoccus tardaugens TaxID=2071624 RepID=UPI00100B0ACF|nr:anthranilate synthase component I [Halegenticoccus tardaugens]
MTADGTDRASDDAGRPSLDRSRAEFADLAASVDGPAVIRVAAPLRPETTPLCAYAALTDRSDYGFLLESAEKVASSDPNGAFSPDGSDPERHARYSFVGYDPDAVVTVTPDGTDVRPLDGRAAELLAAVGSNSDADSDAGTGADRIDGADDADADALDALRRALPDVERVGFHDSERQQLEGGLVGFLAYEAVYDLWLSEVGVERPEPVLPDAQFVLTTKTVVFDDAEDEISLVFTPIVRPGDDPDAAYDELLAEAERVRTTLADADDPETGGFVRAGERAGSREAYEEAVRRAKRRVLDGDIYQGVVSRKRVLSGEIDPVGLYESLREVNPSPYMYLLRHDDLSVVGASPETLVSVRGRRVVSNPIAGTCPRGTSPVEDRRLAGEMLADAKERAEHTMLVDLARNDVRRVSAPGSVRVEEFMNVLKYSHVQHIESTVTGDLAPGADAFDATRAAFPAGTLSGAPKVRAMEIIDELEAEPRGIYGGGVGYYSWGGDADFAIVIRTATIRRGSTDEITVQAGAGIVADSDPAAEFEETEQKMGGVIAAVEAIERESAREATR